MKKLFTLSMVILITLSVFAQAPQKMSYQAVIRNSSNALVTSSPIGMRVSILQGTTPVYVETHATNTNANGLVTIEIGSGTFVSGVAFSAIDWSAGTFYIKTETDPTGGTNYTAIVGTSQLLSVPYAFYATNSETSSDAVTITGNQTITGIKTFNSDLVINGLTIGRGQGAVVTNTAVGSTALYTNSTGAYNTANGYGALISNTIASWNTANGYNALYFNTKGERNTATGGLALYLNTEGTGNTANGEESLYGNTTGSGNTASGNSALSVNTTGRYNTAIGFSAGLNNTSGNNNVFLGFTAGYYETGSNKLFIDNQQRANESDARNKALIYGLFDADPANQVLTINGTLKMQNLNITNLANPVNAQDAATKAYVDASSGGATTHKIGDSYGGGIVFYVYDKGQHGLIAAITDQSLQMQWYNGTNRYTGATGDGLGAGARNTAIIIAAQMNDNQTGNFAAKICADYSVTVNDVTYGDWYLPSKYELNLLYLNQAVVVGFAGAYFSSTEYADTNAWYQDTSGGNQGPTSKAGKGQVRAIRAF